MDIIMLLFLGNTVVIAIILYFVSLQIDLYNSLKNLSTGDKND